MGLGVTETTQPTGYEDIDNMNKAQDELYDKAYTEQQNIVNMQTQQNVDEINRNKDKLNEETTKQNQGLYTDYMKQINPYGANSEALIANGLGNSGASETSKVNLYNTYQKNRTDTLNNARNILAEYNAQIAKAKQDGNIQLAKAALELYNQKIDNIYRNYQLMQNQKQFDYQVNRDKVADEQWKQQFDYNKSVADRNYEYQLNRDKVTDSQWREQFDTNKNQWQQEFDHNKAVADRNYDYQVGRDKVTDEQWKKQFEHQVGRDQVSDSQWLKEYELQKKNLSRSSSRSGGSNQLIVRDDGNELVVADETQNTNEKQDSIDLLAPLRPLAPALKEKGIDIEAYRDKWLASRGYAVIE